MLELFQEVAPKAREPSVKFVHIVGKQLRCRRYKPRIACKTFHSSAVCHCCLLQVEAFVSLRGKIVPTAGGANAAAGAEAAPSFPQTAQNPSPTGPLFPQPQQNTTFSPPETRADGRRIAEIVRNTTPRTVAGQSVSSGYSPRLAGRQFGNLDSPTTRLPSSKVRGNGRIENLYDVVVVESQRCERSRSQELAEEAANFNAFTMPKTGHIC